MRLMPRKKIVTKRDLAYLTELHTTNPWILRVAGCPLLGGFARVGIFGPTFLASH
jgi:hypothetical protein